MSSSHIRYVLIPVIGCLLLCSLGPPFFTRPEDLEGSLFYIPDFETFIKEFTATANDVTDVPWSTAIDSITNGVVVLVNFEGVKGPHQQELSRYFTSRKNMTQRYYDGIWMDHASMQKITQPAVVFLDGERFTPLSVALHTIDDIIVPTTFIAVTDVLCPAQQLAVFLWLRSSRASLDRVAVFHFSLS